MHDRAATGEMQTGSSRSLRFLNLAVGAVIGLIGLALLVATTAVYIFGRNRLRTTSDGFSSAAGQG